MAGDRAAAATFTFHANRCVDGTLNPGCRAVRCTLCTYLVEYRWQNLTSTTKRRLFFIIVPLVAHSCVRSCVLRYILRLFVFSLPFVFSGKVYLLAQFRACHLYRPSHIGFMYVTNRKRKLSVTYWLLDARRLIGLVCTCLHCWSGCRK